MAKTLTGIEGFDLHKDNVTFSEESGLTASSTFHTFAGSPRVPGAVGNSVLHSNGPGADTQWLRWEAPWGGIGDDQTWFYSAGHKMHSSGNGGGGDVRKITFWEGATEHLRIRVDDTAGGVIEVERGDGTSLATSVAGAVVFDVFQQWDMMISIADSGGRCLIEVDGVEVINFTGDTQNGGTAIANRLELRGGQEVDDMILYKGLTSDSLTGPVVIERLDPNGDNSVNYTRSGGTTNEENVDDGRAFDDDSTYVESSTVTDEDLYDFTDASGTLGILGVKVKVRQNKQNVATRKFKIEARPITTIYQSGEFTALLAAYRNETFLWEDNPETAAPFTEAELNATEFGFKITV